MIKKYKVQCLIPNLNTKEINCLLKIYNYWLINWTLDEEEK